jgi:hypothetical protein
MTEPKIMEDTGDAASRPATTSALHKISDVSKPFPKLVTVEFDFSDELQESTACYCPNLPPRRVVNNKNNTAKNNKNVTVDVTTDAIDSPPNKKTKIDDDAPCIYCNSSPCVLDQGLYNLLSEGGLLQDDGQDDIKYIRKQIRHDMYRKASQFIYGPLGKGNRKQLPHCVVSEIHDFAPEDAKENFVGLQKTAVSP